MGIKTDKLEVTGESTCRTPVKNTDAANKSYVDDTIAKRWTFSGGIKFINENTNDGTILAIFKAPVTGTYKVEASLVKDGGTGYSGLSFSVPTDPSKLTANYTAGWFPTLQDTTMKFQRNMEGRVEDSTFNISMNQNDKLLIVAGHAANHPNVKVTYTCTITLS